ncbi:DNA primase [Solicola sp. PLA-1-18]|uniref:DNA primase n=1 Tax=Solicola sp. PLA-1-18 TaxID=3380532 RepID=UPI003B81B2D0
MAGRIREDDVALVRERAKIDEVVEQYVTLRGSGGGNRVGLCPFHDEKSPSFNVTPSRGMYYCFGCGQGGDVFTFLREVEGITFTEAVERLAGRFDVTLRYEDGPGAPRRDHAQRGRLVEANKLAAEFYAEQLTSSADAVAGRRFLHERGFDQAAALKFGVGFAPRSGEALVAHLRAKGVTEDDLVKADLAGLSSRGAYDRFRGRLLWPIREASGDVVGFGARRMFDDDRVDAKYLNTRETPLYKKSQVLYGVDLARREISRASQAVVVEGYTDVMACHEAGVSTAVATCGTAFGEEHGRVLRRLLLDHDAFRGEVIFTFDGDEAGQNAAMRAFGGDEQFVTQTYVAVEPSGQDPCDLRLSGGDAAVRELIASRIPLYRFVLSNVVRQFDLDRGDQRVNAVREAVSLLSSVRDRSKRDAFVREIASVIGVEVDVVRDAARSASSRPSTSTPVRGTPVVAEQEPAVPAGPSLGEAQFHDEREALKAVVQLPHFAADLVADVDRDDFTHPATAALWDAIVAEGLPTAPDPAWVSRVSARIDDPTVQHVLSLLAVDTMVSNGEPTASLVGALLARVQELTTLRRIEGVKSRLQRTNPVDEVTEYNKMFGELVALEAQRRALRERAISGAVL